MLMLETAKYLGTNISCIETGGMFVTLTEYKEEKTAAFPQHAHVNPHLTLLLAGGTEEKWNKRTYERTGGDIAFYPAGEPHHNLQTIAGSKNINFEFEPSFFMQYGFGESAIEQAAEKIQTTKFLMLKIYQEMKCADIYSAGSINMLILELLNGTDRNDKKIKKIPKWMKKVRDSLEENWDKPISLHDLALVAGVHPITISKHFPAYFSCTLGEYLRRLKTEKALGLIKSSRRSLLDIAMECGFADQSHFTRVFKLMTGFLPNDFRKL
jgi:AraC family transcriptional regulator